MLETQLALLSTAVERFCLGTLLPLKNVCSLATHLLLIFDVEAQAYFQTILKTSVAAALHTTMLKFSNSAELLFAP